MQRQSTTTIATLIFIGICILAAVYLSQPGFQRPDVQIQQPANSSETHTAEKHRTQNDSFCLGGCPVGMPKDDVVLTHHILKLSNNPGTKFADWVAYKITQETLGKGCRRTWERDPDLDPDTTLSPSDYRGIRQALASDRGHQAPLASLCGSPYWQEADYLSNITPQKAELNEGVWEHLEDHERKLLEDGYSSAVYSLTGPLYERDMPSLPYAREEMRVPSGYWKIITIQEGQNLEAAAFIMDQDSGRDDDYCSKQAGLEEIEGRAHLHFFPGLAQDDKIKLEHHQKAILNDLGCN